MSMLHDGDIGSHGDLKSSILRSAITLTKKDNSSLSAYYPNSMDAITVRSVGVLN